MWKKMASAHWLQDGRKDAPIVLYVFADNYLSFNGIDPNRLRFQLATMLVFVGIVGIGRPYIDRWLMKSNHK
jgi:hypothetical protein